MKTSISLSLSGEEIRRRFIALKSQNEMSKRMSNSAFARYIFEMYEQEAILKQENLKANSGNSRTLSPLYRGVLKEYINNLNFDIANARA